jgi:hypothetical protein
MKKAQIEVSFNWIFVLIAGFAILMFFYMIINAQTSSSQEQLSRTITQRMGSIFESIQASPDTAEVHSRINFELQFTCFKGVHEFRRGGGASSAYLENSIIFTPKVIGSSSLLTFNKRLSMPFLITPILYLSDERTHYHFHDSLSITHNSLDDIFSKSIGSEFNLETQASNYRRVVYVIPSTISYPSVIPSNVDVVVVNTNGLVTFGFEGANLNYFSNEMLLGAIISGDYDITKCNFDKINQSFERVKYVLNERKTDISSEENLRLNCQNLYAAIDLTRLNFDLTYADFFSNSASLDSRNRELERLSCPTIY